MPSGEDVGVEVMQQDEVGRQLLRGETERRGDVVWPGGAACVGVVAGRWSLGMRI